MALGTFVVHVTGKCYGVSATDATLLAVPFGSMKRRIAMRGQHRAQFSKFSDAKALVEALISAVYTGSRPNDMTLGLSPSEVAKSLDDNFIEWGPDGDEAFDDSSHIYQFDVGDSVRIVACKHCDDLSLSDLSDIWLPSDEFYGVLDNWQRQFEFEWHALRIERPDQTRD